MTAARRTPSERPLVRDMLPDVRAALDKLPLRQGLRVDMDEEAKKLSALLALCDSPEAISPPWADPAPARATLSKFKERFREDIRDLSLIAKIRLNQRLRQLTAELARVPDAQPTDGRRPNRGARRVHAAAAKAFIRLTDRPVSPKEKSYYVRFLDGLLAAGRIDAQATTLARRRAPRKVT